MFIYHTSANVQKHVIKTINFVLQVNNVIKKTTSSALSFTEKSVSKGKACNNTKVPCCGNNTTMSSSSQNGNVNCDCNNNCANCTTCKNCPKGCEDVCNTDDSYPFSDHNFGCGGGQGCVDVCEDSGCDVLQSEVITSKLKRVLNQLCLLNTILCSLRKEFISKINCFALCDPECCIGGVDIDQQNRLMYTSYKQIESLIMKNNCLFVGSNDTHQVKIYLKNGQSLVVCALDNVKFSLESSHNEKYLFVNIGTKTFKICFLSKCMSNSDAICVLKKNFCIIESILYALATNKKSIEHWVNLAKNMDKCNDMCKDDSDCKCKSKKSCC